MARNKTKQKKNHNARKSSSGPKRPKTMRRAGARKTSMGMGNPQAMQVTRAICSLTDPFCVGSIGTRWPDTSSAPTLPLHVDAFYTFASDAAGSGAITIMPTFPYGILGSSVSGTTATSSGTWTAVDANLTTYFTNNVGQYRVVNWGVEVIPIVATMTNQGYFVVAETITQRGVSGTYVTPSTTYPNVHFSNLVGDKVAFISRPQGADAFSFDSPNTNAGSSDLRHSGVTITITGAEASKNCLVVRIRANIEYEQLNNSYYGTTARASPSNPTLTDLVSKVRAKMEPIVKGGAEVVEKKMMNWASEQFTKHIGGMLGGMAGAFFGPTGAVAGAQIGHMIMDVD